MTKQIEIKTYSNSSAYSNKYDIESFELTNNLEIKVKFTNPENLNNVFINAFTNNDISLKIENIIHCSITKIIIEGNYAIFTIDNNKIVAIVKEAKVEAKPEVKVEVKNEGQKK
jgi:hypothetical protein